jgi:hypothetical protein
MTGIRHNYTSPLKIGAPLLTIFPSNFVPESPIFSTALIQVSVPETGSWESIVISAIPPLGVCTEVLWQAEYFERAVNRAVGVEWRRMQRLWRQFLDGSEINPNREIVFSSILESITCFLFFNFRAWEVSSFHGHLCWRQWRLFGRPLSVWLHSWIDGRLGLERRPKASFLVASAFLESAGQFFC